MYLYVFGHCTAGGWERSNREALEGGCGIVRQVTNNRNEEDMRLTSVWGMRKSYEVLQAADGIC